MKTMYLLGFALIGATVCAQDIDAAKKAMDAEQFEKAKQILKQTIQAKPTNGKAAYFLGTVYLKQDYVDSAKVCFQRGLTATESGKLNTIGLAQIDLDQNKVAEAQQKIDGIIKDLKKRDIEEYIFIARSYMNISHPDYATALTYLEKAKLVNPNDPQLNLAMGDAYYGEKKQNEAYVAYRSAYQLDSSLLRAKVQLGVLLKGAKAFNEAINAYNEVVGINANYGPVYRELAETYYLWANNDPKKYTEYIKLALDYYTKYMSLTDYSVTSRMRHADFLILARDYKTLEEEANKIKELDKINPRIYRYLGYAAYENGNFDGAVTALSTFVNGATNKIIARDYFFLGLAQLRKSLNAETKSADQVLLDASLANIKKALEMEPVLAVELNEVGKKVYETKIFNAAAAVFELAISNTSSKNYTFDNLYLGNALYYYNTRKDIAKPDPIMLQKAVLAFETVIERSPSTIIAYLFCARTYRLLENDEKMAEYYRKFIEVSLTKLRNDLNQANQANPATTSEATPNLNVPKLEEFNTPLYKEALTKISKNLIEAYNNLGAHFANIDKTKAVDSFNQTLLLDPTNDYATKSLAMLK
ncbi:MAG: hypothetical protein CFE24_04805 [Flavobacterium sp. BFFFF2]|nr:MAG: hypothetical protein CFE24_04805 [Flavobacterium sp. BFFFF2]